MFDFGKLTDVVSSLFGAAAGQSGAGILQQIESLGIDPSALQGLDAGQLGELLSSHGIDLAGLDATQITDLAQQLGGSGELAANLGEWVSQQLPRS